MKAPYPRTRTRDNRVRVNYVQTLIDDRVVPQAITVTTYTNGALSGVLEVMNDIVTPGFQSISDDGGIVNSPMSRVSEETFFSTGSDTVSVISPPSQVGKYIYQNTGRYGDRLDAHIPGQNLKGHGLASIDTLKHAKLAGIQAMNNVQPLFVQGLVSLTELPKTLKLLASTAKTLYQVIKGVKTGNAQMVMNAIGRPNKKFDNRSWLSRSTGNRWLEFRYGWTPLMMELQGALKALDKSRKLKARATARGRSKAYASSSVSVPYDLGAQGVENWRYQSQQQVDVRAWCLYEADLKYQSVRDFGLTELPLAAWEVVPFSFVVDWFIPIGAWLEAVTPKLGVSILSSGYVIRNDVSVKRDLFSYVPPLPHATLGRFVVAGRTANDWYVRREVSRVLGLNVLLASPPPFNVKINIKRAADAIALLKALTDK